MLKESWSKILFLQGNHEALTSALINIIDVLNGVIKRLDVSESTKLQWKIFFLSFPLFQRNNHYHYNKNFFWFAIFFFLSSEMKHKINQQKLIFKENWKRKRKNERINSKPDKKNFKNCPDFAYCIFCFIFHTETSFHWVPISWESCSWS